MKAVASFPFGTRPPLLQMPKKGEKKKEKNFAHDAVCKKAVVLTSK